MNLLSLFASIVFAAETAAVPFFNNSSIVAPPLQPAQSFAAIAKIVQPIPSPVKPQVQETPIPTKHYTLAILGDSMVDTLGDNAPELAGGLTTFFPHTTWTILNYGVGATTIDYGIERITHPYTYKGQTFPALAARHPDFLIVESFAYNPYTNGNDGLTGYQRQLKTLLRTLQTAMSNTPIVFAVTIAPNSQTFGDGAPAIAFSPAEKRARTDTIKSYLTAAIRFAKNNHLMLADLYDASLMSNGDGNPIFISSTDHIHYSTIGRMLFTQKVIETIAVNHLVK